MKTWLLWILTIFTLIIALIVSYTCCPNNVSAYGSIFSAAGAFIAVIWFYNSLQQQNESIKLQTKQIEEQRQQFQAEFKILRQESKRSAIITAKEILKDMDKDVTASLNNIGQIKDLPVLFLKSSLSSLNIIMKNDDPENIMNEIEKINQILVPAKTFLSAFRDAAQLVLEEDNIATLPKDSEPEWFVEMYGKDLMYRPFLSKYYSTAIMLSGMMTYVKLDIVTIAFMSANALLLKQDFFKEGVVVKEILKFKLKYPGTKINIVEKYLKTVNQEDIDKISKEIEDENKNDGNQNESI